MMRFSIQPVRQGRDTGLAATVITGDEGEQLEAAVGKAVVNWLRFDDVNYVQIERGFIAGKVVIEYPPPDKE